PECENGGICFAGVCFCPDGFTGDECEDLSCDDGCSEDISGGECDGSTGLCVCNEDFSGDDCSVYTPDGSCKYGVSNGSGCTCQLGYSGDFCQCKSNCSSHGLCRVWGCECDDGYSGDDCSEEAVPLLSDKISVDFDEGSITIYFDTPVTLSGVSNDVRTIDCSDVVEPEFYGTCTDSEGNDSYRVINDLSMCKKSKDGTSLTIFPGTRSWLSPGMSFDLSAENWIHKVTLKTSPVPLTVLLDANMFPPAEPPLLSSMLLPAVVASCTLDATIDLFISGIVTRGWGVPLVRWELDNTDEEMVQHPALSTVKSLFEEFSVLELPDDADQCAKYLNTRASIPSSVIQDLVTSGLEQLNIILSVRTIFSVAWSSQSYSIDFVSSGRVEQIRLLRGLETITQDKPLHISVDGDIPLCPDTSWGENVSIVDIDRYSFEWRCLNSIEDHLVTGSSLSLELEEGILEIGEYECSVTMMRPGDGKSVAEGSVFVTVEKPNIDLTLVANTGSVTLESTTICQEGEAATCTFDKVVQPGENVRVIANTTHYDNASYGWAIYREDDSLAFKHVGQYLNFHIPEYVPEIRTFRCDCTAWIDGEVGIAPATISMYIIVQPNDIRVLDNPAYFSATSLVKVLGPPVDETIDGSGTNVISVKDSLGISRPVINTLPVSNKSTMYVGTLDSIFTPNFDPKQATLVETSHNTSIVIPYTELTPTKTTVHVSSSLFYGTSARISPSYLPPPVDSDIVLVAISMYTPDIIVRGQSATFRIEFEYDQSDEFNWESDVSFSWSIDGIDSDTLAELSQLGSVNHSSISFRQSRIVEITQELDDDYFDLSCSINVSNGYSLVISRTITFDNALILSDDVFSVYDTVDDTLDGSYDHPFMCNSFQIIIHDAVTDDICPQDDITYDQTENRLLCSTDGFTNPEDAPDLVPTVAVVYDQIQTTSGFPTLLGLSIADIIIKFEAEHSKNNIFVPCYVMEEDIEELEITALLYARSGERKTVHFSKYFAKPEVDYSVTGVRLFDILDQSASFGAYTANSIRASIAEFEYGGLSSNLHLWMNYSLDLAWQCLDLVEYITDGDPSLCDDVCQASLALSYHNLSHVMAMYELLKEFVVMDDWDTAYGYIHPHEIAIWGIYQSHVISHILPNYTSYSEEVYNDVDGILNQLMESSELGLGAKIGGSVLSLDDIESGYFKRMPQNLLFYLNYYPDAQSLFDEERVTSIFQVCYDLGTCSHSSDIQHYTTIHKIAEFFVRPEISIFKEIEEFPFGYARDTMYSFLHGIEDCSSAMEPTYHSSVHLVSSAYDDSTSVCSNPFMCTIALVIVSYERYEQVWEVFEDALINDRIEFPPNGSVANPFKSNRSYFASLSLDDMLSDLPVHVMPYYREEVVVGCPDDYSSFTCDKCMRVEIEIEKDLTESNDEYEYVPVAISIPMLPMNDNPTYAPTVSINPVIPVLVERGEEEEEEEEDSDESVDSTRWYVLVDAESVIFVTQIPREIPKNMGEAWLWIVGGSILGICFVVALVFIGFRIYKSRKGRKEYLIQKHGGSQKDIKRSKKRRSHRESKSYSTSPDRDIMHYEIPVLQQSNPK
ncbi:hypothetical protein ADUPG1_013567, partial [Aduncisulcus paluster]